MLQNPALLQFLVIAAYNLFSLSYWLICFREKAMVVGLILFDRLFFRELFCFYIKSKALIFPTNKKKIIFLGLWLGDCPTGPPTSYTIKRHRLFWLKLDLFHFSRRSPAHRHRDQHYVQTVNLNFVFPVNWWMFGLSSYPRSRKRDLRLITLRGMLNFILLSNLKKMNTLHHLLRFQLDLYNCIVKELFNSVLKTD